MDSNVRSFKTKYGWITIKEVAGKITLCQFTKSTNKGSQSLLAQLEKALQNYLLAQKPLGSWALANQGTVFEQKVWTEIGNIPFGQTQTYQALAQKLNTSARAIGNACRKNNLLLLVPCHRVVRSDGTFGGYAAPQGLKLKTALSRQEQQTDNF